MSLICKNSYMLLFDGSLDIDAILSNSTFVTLEISSKSIKITEK